MAQHPHISTESFDRITGSPFIECFAGAARVRRVADDRQWQQKKAKPQENGNDKHGC